MRLTDDQKTALLYALEIYESAGDVVAETGLPMRTVIHYQRLYGPARFQLQRAEEDRQRVDALKHQPLQVVDLQRAAGSHPLEHRKARWLR